MKKHCDKPTTFMVHDNLSLNINGIGFRYEYEDQELNNQIVLYYKIYVFINLK